MSDKPIKIGVIGHTDVDKNTIVEAMKSQGVLVVDDTRELRTLNSLLALDHHDSIFLLRKTHHDSWPDNPFGRALDSNFLPEVKMPKYKWTDHQPSPVGTRPEPVKVRQKNNRRKKYQRKKRRGY